jgi:DNA helicase IV
MKMSNAGDRLKATQSTNPSKDDLASLALAEEQAHLDKVHVALDGRIAELRGRLGSSWTRQTHVQLAQEQELLEANNREQLRNLESVTGKLCFGRIDLEEGSSYRLGRIGLTDGEDERVLIDWRAPVAAAFYQASATNPLGLRRRRHLRTNGRDVVKVSDDVFDNHLLEVSVLSEDGSLFAALNAERTGRMGDIVSTIQAHQDKVMRSTAEGLLIIDGAPGTGKTVVALHRAAYLLFNRREQLARRGVLIIGPNPQFLRYIEDVLPSLGETHVALSTIGQLVPGFTGTKRDHAALAELKADTRMAEVIATAVRQRVRIPANGLTINHDGEQLVLTSGQLRSAVRFGKDQDTQYNGGRAPFLQKLLEELVDQLAELRGYPPQDPFARHEIHDELRASPVVRRNLNLMWMPLTPQKLLGELLNSPSALTSATDGILTSSEQELLRSSAAAWGAENWSIDDIPLIDEACELLGPVPIKTAQGYAEEGYEDLDGEDNFHNLTVAERAAEDREWTYGHLVVDEAQELTPMAWRMLLRRVPMRSITVVGDLSQRTTPGAIRSWDDLTSTVTKSTVETFDVNYRTPAAVMNLATSMLQAAGGPRRDISSVRDLPDAVTIHNTAEEVENLISEAVLSGNGAVIVADTTNAPELLQNIHPTWVLIDAFSAKGMEFDEVLVYDPVAVQAASGATGLYVSLTRPTKKLHLYSPSGVFPAGFEEVTETKDSA